MQRMAILSTLRRQQRRRARSVLGLLVLVWLNVALQSCAAAAPDTELSDNRPVRSEALHESRDHSGNDPDHDCEQCLDCQHDSCSESSLCGGPVVVSTKVEIRLPDNTEFESTVAAMIDDLDLAASSLNTSLMRPEYGVTAAAVPLTVRYCVYLI